ncbi:hypothetical protein QE152_g12459 [Popillia japonica]|uniref:Uncharacterized protein n=1 Tax=Popillia japonica TaxID=7064 RepID=A0AAW1LRD0_POPJA
MTSPPYQINPCVVAVTQSLFRTILIGRGCEAEELRQPSLSDCTDETFNKCKYCLYGVKVKKIDQHN